MPPTRRWIVHQPNRPSSAWPSALRREVVAAFRRGTMDAGRCLSTFGSHGEESVLPPAAVAYLAWRVADDRGDCLADDPALGAGFGLARLDAVDRDAFEALVEAGRLFFFPGGPEAG